MNKNIVLIQSHCNTEEKIKVLLENLSKLRNYNLDLLLYSHITLPQEVIEKVDYFVYDKSNPIMWEERRHYYWRATDKYKLESTVPDYGWTVFNQISGGFQFIKNKNYENIIVFCYDTIIDEKIEDYLINPRQQLFEHHKSQKNDKTNDTSPVVLGVALIFFIFEKNDFEILISNLSRNEYSKNFNLIAEKYFEKKLIDTNLYSKPTIVVYDSLHESKNIFNQSDDENYTLFIDNQKLLKFILYNKKNIDLKIIINEDIIVVTHGEFSYNNDIESLKTFGLLVDNIFHNLLPKVNELRTNKITFF
jgi:hypothetical protein